MSLDLDACRENLDTYANCADARSCREIGLALIEEVERLRAQLDKPCGSCHPCTNWPAETWRQAGRHLPDVHRFGEMEDELKRQREEVERLRTGLRNLAELYDSTAREFEATGAETHAWLMRAAAIGTRAYLDGAS